MKIAIVYSGLYRTFDGWLDNHKSVLPSGDYYFTTWESERSKVDIDDMVYNSPPKITYNLYQGEFAKKYGKDIQNKDFEKPRLYTACLQHAGHYLALKNIKEDYDIVIRMRYDTFLGNHSLKFLELCNFCNNTGVSIGIGNTSNSDDKNEKMYQIVPSQYSTKEFMLDFMNIHKYKNIENVLQLIEDKEMFPTNAGWWQILSKRGWGHKNYRGGIQLARHISRFRNKVNG